MGQEKPAKRLDLIKTVQTPLGFFVLVVLVVEALQGSVAHTGSAPNNTYALFGMIAILTLLIVIVALMALFRPEALHGDRKQAANSAVSAAVVYPPTEIDRYKELFGGFSDSDFYAFNPPFEVEHVGDKLLSDACAVHEQRYQSGVKSRYLYFNKSQKQNADVFFKEVAENLGIEDITPHVSHQLWENSPEQPNYTFFIGYKNKVPAIILYPSAVMEHGIPKAVIYIEGAEDLLVILKEYFVRQWNMAKKEQFSHNELRAT